MPKKLMHSSISILIFALLGCHEKAKSTPDQVQTNQNSEQISNEATRVVIAGGPHQSAHLPFDWSIYEDPSRPEFWADGADGILPRPFLYLAGNPTRENASKLIAWQNRQWQAIEEIVKALGGASEIEAYSQLIGENIIDHLSSTDRLLSRLEPKTDNIVLTSDTRKQPSVDWASVGVVYIYRSDCPHCRRQTAVIEGARKLGAKVIPLQLDDGQPLHPDSQAYYAGQWQDFFPLDEAKATPTLFLIREGAKPVRHTGYLSLGQLTHEIKHIGG